MFFRATDSLDVARGAGLGGAPCVESHEAAGPPPQLLANAGPVAETTQAVVLARPNQPAPVAKRAPTAGTSAISAAASLARRVAMQHSLENAEHVICRGLTELFEARRVVLVFRDREGKPFCTPRVTPTKAERSHAVHVFRTKQPTPASQGAERSFAFPIVSGREPVAVCIVVRDVSADAFSRGDVAVAAQVARHVCPSLVAILLDHCEADARRHQPLFREEALEHQNSGKRHGELVRISPRWVQATFWFVLALAVTGALFLTFTHVDRMSLGPATVRLRGEPVTARMSATVSRVRVQPNQRVEKGQPLLELYSAEEAAALAEVESEYRVRLAAYLLAPGDASARSGLATTVARRERAQAAVSEKLVRASASGVLRGLRLEPGSVVEPGDRIGTIETREAPPELLAFLPGTDRPQLKEGMIVRLSVPGYQALPVTAVIRRVSAEVVGPAEAQKMLGHELAGAVNIGGAVTVVEAELSSRHYEADGRQYDFHDGMPLEAEISIESERLAAALLRGIL